jgi:hypothetical protein
MRVHRECTGLMVLSWARVALSHPYPPTLHLTDYCVFESAPAQFLAEDVGSVPLGFRGSVRRKGDQLVWRGQWTLLRLLAEGRGEGVVAALPQIEERRLSGRQTAS